MRQRQQMAQQFVVLAFVLVFVSVSAISIKAEAPQKKIRFGPRADGGFDEDSQRIL